MYWYVCGVKNLCEQPIPAPIIVAEAPLPPPPAPEPEVKPEPVPEPEPAPEPEPPLVLPDIYFILDRDIVKNMDELISSTKHAMEYLARNPDRKVYITGYTCNMGTEEHNYNLGLVRASAVKKYMSSQGIPEDQIIVDSKGPSDPKAPNDTQEDRMENRRVHVTIK